MNFRQKKERELSIRRSSIYDLETKNDRIRKLYDESQIRNDQLQKEYQNSMNALFKERKKQIIWKEKHDC